MKSQFEINYSDKSLIYLSGTGYHLCLNNQKSYTLDLPTLNQHSLNLPTLNQHSMNLNSLHHFFGGLDLSQKRWIQKSLIDAGNYKLSAQTQ